MSSSCENCLESTVTTIKSVCDITDWSITNRGGFAQLAGLLMVPSQYIGPDQQTAEEIIDSLSSCSIKKFNIKENGTEINGLIYFPPDWDTTDNSRCVLYHNPNGITAAGYFSNGNLSWTPYEICKLRQCPIIFYDYRGTGLSKDNLSCSSTAFRPTYDSIVVDGSAVLRMALNSFRFVEIWGSSLGGGVATVSLDQHLAIYPNDVNRVDLTNHDSFSKTSRVIMPSWKKTGDCLGYIFGGQLNAEKSMMSLIDKGVKITIICHENDPVIPEGARIIDSFGHLLNTNLLLVKSPLYGHANLSQDLISFLHDKNKKPF